MPRKTSGWCLSLVTILSAWTVLTRAVRSDSHFERRHRGHSVWPSAASLPEATASVTAIAVLNPFPWCYEVVFGAVHSLQLSVQVVDVYVDYWEHWEGSGAADFLQSIHARPVRDCKQFWENFSAYQVVIWTDHYGWEFEERRNRGPRDLLDLGFTGKIWLFNHEPRDVLWPMVCECEEGRKWIHDEDYQYKTAQVFGHRQVEWFTIAPHVAATLQSLLDEIGYKKKVEWILPVFPWSNTSQLEASWQAANFQTKKGFSIQGNPDAHRRNYTGLLKDVAASPDLMANSRFELDLFSWKELDPDIVPSSVLSKIVYKHLKFPAFYSEIHNTLALMLLFPGNRYYETASSSSIATALSAGVPMIVDSKFLEVYSFVLPAAVVVSHASTHAAAMQQVLALTADEWTELANMVALSREAAVLRNLQIFSKAFSARSL